MFIGTAATIAAANTALITTSMNQARHRSNMQRQFMQNNLSRQQARLRRQSESQEYEQTQCQQVEDQQSKETPKIFLTEEQKKEERQRIEEQKLDRKLDYALLAWGCNQLICPLDLLDPETWEFRKEECPFCKSCFEITPFDWCDGLHTSFGRMGCFTYKENLFNNDDPPIKKIIKKLKYKERNIDIMKENFEEYLEIV